MLPNDLLCRSVLFPRGFDDDVFELATFMRSKRRYENGPFVISVGSRFLLKNDEGAHQYGRRAAEVANEGELARSNGVPIPETEIVHYLAFYDITHSDVVGTKADWYRIGVSYRPEHGNDAHFEIELSESGGSRKQRKDDRAAVEMLLASRLVGPVRDVIDHPDAKVRARLQAAVLPVSTGIDWG